jgi:hypothetical protein
VRKLVGLNGAPPCVEDLTVRVENAKQHNDKRSSTADVHRAAEFPEFPRPSRPRIVARVRQVSRDIRSRAVRPIMHLRGGPRAIGNYPQIAKLTVESGAPQAVEIEASGVAAGVAVYQNGMRINCERGRGLGGVRRSRPPRFEIVSKASFQVGRLIRTRFDRMSHARRLRARRSAAARRWERDRWGRNVRFRLAAAAR